METGTVTLDADSLIPRLQAALEAGGSFPLTVTGGSMLPVLRPGKSRVLLAKAERLEKWQILFFRRDTGECILHRAVKMGDLITVGGDAQSWKEPVRPQQVIAVVTHIYRRGKWRKCHRLHHRLGCFFWQFTRPIRPWLFRAYAGMRIARKL